MVWDFFTFLQALQVVSVNVLLVHNVVTLDTTSFGHIWISCLNNK